MPATKPLVMVGRSASSRSSVSAASVALEHTNVAAGEQGGQQRECDPADPEERRVAEQLVLGGQSADLVEDVLVSEQGRVGVHHPLGALVEPDVYTIASGSERRRRAPSPPAARSSTVVAGSESIRTWRSERDCDLVDVGSSPACGSRVSGRTRWQAGSRRRCRRVVSRHLGRGGERRERHDYGADAGRGQHRDDPRPPRSGRARRHGCPCPRRGRSGRGPDVADRRSASA